MKRYYINVLIIFLLILSIFNGKNAKADLPLQGKVIVVDAGHGGLDPGAVYKDIYEKDITLNISVYLSDFLSEMGASVILTRDSDKDLSNGVKNHRKKSDFDKRIEIINEKYVDLYISIHLNYLEDKRYDGPQVFYNKNNKHLAQVIQKYLNDKLNNDREIKKIPSLTYMYDKLSKKGVLIECGFLSNDKERNKLITKEYQKEIAKHISMAILQYYK